MEVKDLAELVAQYSEARTARLEFEKQLEPLKERENELKARVLGCLEAEELETFKCEAGTVSRVVKKSVKLPQGDDRERFYAYLEQQGELGGLLTINSQTLNKWHKSEMEKREVDGLSLDIPGLEGCVSEYVDLSLRRS